MGRWDLPWAAVSCSFSLPTYSKRLHCGRGVHVPAQGRADWEKLSKTFETDCFSISLKDKRLLPEAMQSDFHTASLKIPDFSKLIVLMCMMTWD